MQLQERSRLLSPLKDDVKVGLMTEKHLKMFGRTPDSVP
jgi:hypothetical protein